MQVSKNTQVIVNKELPFTGSVALVERFCSIAQTMQRNQTFLIAGESGTGKTLLAKFICQHSPSYNKKTRIVRLDEIPDDLLEKELFGHNGFEGRIKAADEGTLILKDVAHLPWHLQAQFLRLLEENEFECLGEAATVKMNLRTVFVTSENLFQAALENRFRQDL